MENITICIPLGGNGYSCFSKVAVVNSLKYMNGMRGKVMELWKA